MEINAAPYRQSDIEGPAHPYELPERENVTIHLDYRQMGVGGDDSWGARPHAEYSPQPNQRHEYRIRIEPAK